MGDGRGECLRILELATYEYAFDRTREVVVSVHVETDAALVISARRWWPVRALRLTACRDGERKDDAAHARTECIACSTLRATLAG